jgi:hypothetical protein
MKTKHLKFAALAVATLVGLIVSFHSGVHAQDKQNPPQITTNWMGCLVIGAKDSGDPIVFGGPFPQAKAEFDIGLRSDGVVVWRKARP